MRFLIDAQLPPALARWIAANGHEAQHVHDIGLEGASDGAIWREAARSNAVIMTKDEDFIHLSRLGEGPQVIWVTSGNTKRQVLLNRMVAIFSQIVAALEAGERIVEVR
jgi:predicted nuclease of predicted toxin-antitoxin system